MSTGADSFYDATDISIPYEGGEYISDEKLATTYENMYYEDDENTLYGVDGEPRLPSAWWKITPETNGQVTLDVSVADYDHDVYLDVFTGGPSISNLIKAVPEYNNWRSPNPEYSATQLIFPVVANTTYYIRYAPSNWGLPWDWSSGPGPWWEGASENQRATMRLKVSGPRTVYQGATGPSGPTGPTGPSGSEGDLPVVNGKYQATVTSAQLIRIEMNAPVIEWLPYFDARPAQPAQIDVLPADEATTTLEPYYRAIVEATPVIGVSTLPGAAFAQVSVTSFQPADQSVLPTLNPMFTFVVRAAQSFKIELQLDDTTAFDSPMSIVRDVDDSSGNFTSYIQFSEYLEDSKTYYWRYRLLSTDDAVDTGWLGPFSFSVNTTRPGTTYTGSWSVSNLAAAPHIWFADPPRGQPGDVVDVYGQNLITPGVRVQVDGVEAEVTETVSQQAAEGPDVVRKIDAVNAEVTVEHDVVTFIVPDVEAPGGEIVVRT